MGYLTISTNVRRYQTNHRWHLFLSGRQLIGAHALCVQHSPTAAVLSTSFLLNHAPPNSPSWTHWLQDLESHTAAWVWVMSQKDWRNQREIGWILAMHWYSIWVKKKWFSCFPVLPGSAEAHVIWGGIAKRLLIAYFISNISAKKISKCVHVCQSYSNANVGRFFEIECIYICLTSQLMANPQKTARQNSQSTTTFMTIRQNVKTGTN